MRKKFIAINYLLENSKLVLKYARVFHEICSKNVLSAVFEKNNLKKKIKMLFSCLLDIYYFLDLRYIIDMGNFHSSANFRFLVSDGFTHLEV